MAVGKDLADKFYKLAEDNPKDPVATDALFWIVQNAAGSTCPQKAADKVATLIAEMPLKPTSAAPEPDAEPIRPSWMPCSSGPRRRKKIRRSRDLLAWAATNAYYLPAGQKAIERLIEKYPDHAGRSSSVCDLSAAERVPDADAMLKQILEKNDKPKVKAAAALGPGPVLLRPRRTNWPMNPPKPTRSRPRPKST